MVTFDMTTTAIPANTSALFISLHL
jgi:hypothetical protein